MAKKYSVYILVCIVFLIALSLRLYRVSEYPVGFHIDEAILGYTGYSILLTGKDTTNTPFPLYTEVFGDYIPTGYHYLTIPAIVMFGLTEFSTRLPGVILGSLMVIALYFLTNALFRNRAIAAISSISITFSPWHFLLSRSSSETLASLFFVVFGFACVVVSLRRGSIIALTIGCVFLIISYFFYHTPRIFVPMMFLGMVLLTLPMWHQYSKQFKIGLVGQCIFIGVIGLALLFGGKGSSRFQQVSIFHYPEIRLVMEEQFREDGISGVPLFLTRIFHNKMVHYTQALLSNYSEYFTVQTLFLRSALPPIFSIPNTGLFHLILLPFLLIGGFVLLTRRDSFSRIVLLWVFLAPLVAALTVDDIPNIRRAAVLFPMLEIIAAFGFWVAIKKLPIPLARGLIAVVVLFFFFYTAYFMHQYFVNARVHRPWYRNNGFKEMLVTVRENYNKYDRVIITKTMGGIYPLVLFYMKFNPAEYQDAGSPKDTEYSGFGKFYFVPEKCPSLERKRAYHRDGKTLYIDNADCNEKGEVISREDHTPVFRIVYKT